ncbi:addiction module antidote protein [Methylovorus glucosotrophus]|uniref:Putative addiction module antidote protein n=1 Tax=Methylovorus glucosotrophus (strain SIP3-4) TaxID=582744 RepID=C6XA71_METGS|nr:addiction module antidote protein [Methylovorus glucosotrophus]ACT51612.1 putative addiction module antidote protein [Methylovorus glucosotrophus SIP3-4]
MTEKIDVASLRDFNPAEYITDKEDFKGYLDALEEEGELGALTEGLLTLFQAKGALMVAEALGVDVREVWDAQQQPEEHQKLLLRILELLKKG